MSLDGSRACVYGIIDRFAVGQIDMDGLHPFDADVGVVPNDDLAARVECELRGGGTHSTSTAYDEHALSLESEGVKEGHDFFSRGARVGVLLARGPR